MTAYPVLEHRAGRTGRWLRDRRGRLALIVAIVETALVLAGVLGWFWIVLLAGVIFTFHLFIGRRARFDWLRELSWIATIAQTLPVLVPIAIVVVGTLVVLAILAGAVVVLALLFLGRR